MSFEDDNEKDESFTYVTYDEKGYPTWHAQMTHKGITKRVDAIVPPDHVMPIIFVPGIMGSNLRVKGEKYGKTGKDHIAWRPGDSYYTAVTFGKKSPAQRLALLDPEKTEVDDRIEVDIPFGMINTLDGPLSDKIKHSLKTEFHRRKWGTVMLSSYADIMINLELNLNRIYDPEYGRTSEIARYWKEDIIDFEKKSRKILKPTEPWGVFLDGYKDLNIEDLKNVADKYWFPVHGGGYNWLRSSECSGSKLAKQAEDIITNYKDQGFTCEQVIIVTHSMGGLVARAMCHSEMGNAASIVAGIVHGEQPALGAATAYKRMHAGFEASICPVDLLTARALGWTGKEVTAVFANSEGAMQLLPTKRYPAKWLRIQAVKNQNLMELPVSDPYNEIYKERYKWWRLMTPEWIKPMKKETNEEGLDVVWGLYLNRVELVANFHKDLNDYYHGNTHTHYGADENHRAWTNITWLLHKKDPADYIYPDMPPPEVTTEASTAEFVKTNALGKITIRQGAAISNYRLCGPDTPGDGTVPECSGADSAKTAKFATKMKGYDHQDSYEKKSVKDVTTYSVIRIAMNK